MSRLAALKKAQGMHALADILEVPPARLAYLAFHMPTAEKYRQFNIPKKKGGERKIQAPNDKLKHVQQNVGLLLQDCVFEIEESRPVAYRYAHGFMRQRSILTNATIHRNRRYVFNIDLEDFFGSINFGRVRGFFIKDRNFALHPEVATILAAICTHENKLPQGGPSSPVISNLIANILDAQLSQIAQRNKCAYSRYADDLTFSSNTRSFPEDIAKVDASGHWILGQRLLDAIARCGFRVNEGKSRMQLSRSRQQVTGLVVNRRVNVTREYRHSVRAMADSLFKRGSFVFPAVGSGEPLVGSGDQLHGMLCHINHIDETNRSRTASDEPRTGKRKDTGPESDKCKLFRRFLIFKHFFRSELPVIVCEGKTDNVYLRYALRSRIDGFPRLGFRHTSESFIFSVKFFRYTDTSTGKILQLTGGADQLKSFAFRYVAESERFAAPGRKHPVIILVDGDDGANKKFVKPIENRYGVKIGVEGFMRIRGNLYAVVTPGKTIEDCFTADVLETRIGGKEFDRFADKETENFYSKAVFAEQVVKANASQIDFSGFDPLLRRIESAIADHYGRFGSPQD